jgi:hypothetical protein
MWSDEMDKKIRDAAENDIQNYQEKDWKGMEGLLDKHLPQRKRRRGIIVFFLLAALSVSGYLLVSSVSSSRSPVAQREEEVIAADPGKPGSTEATDKTKSEAREQITSGTKPTAPVNDKPSSIQQQKDLTIPAAPSQIIATTPVKTISGGKNDKFQDKQPVATRSDQLSRNSRTSKSQRNLNPTTEVIVDNHISPVAPDKKDKETKNITVITDNQQTIPPIDPVTAQSDKQETKQPATTITEDKAAISEPIAGTDMPAKKEKSPKSFGSRFSLTASAGPDYSSVHFKYKGEVRLAYGIGVGYAINDRLTIRTGIYAGRKVYTADSKTYKTGYIPAGYKLEDINADCYVIEVPVNLVYNFATSKNHGWFASAGLSSYFMKKEEYLYNVTYMGGQRKTWLYEHRNENTHPFSVVNLSAGYQLNFNKRFSLLAEPYVKMPIGKGVGSGKVMLNNAGILFTAGWKPFGKR